MGVPCEITAVLLSGDSAERKRHRKPMDPDAKRKEHETSQFHRARGQMMTYNNLAQPAKSKHAPDIDDSKKKKLKVGTLRAVTVVKPKAAGPAAGGVKGPDAAQESAGAQQRDEQHSRDGDQAGAAAPAGEQSAAQSTAVLGLALADYGSDSD